MMAMSDDDSSTSEHVVPSLLTPDEFLEAGLLVVGYKKRRLTQARATTNEDRFVAHFGSNQYVCAQIWEDFQTFDEARINASDLNVTHFLMALHFLKAYPNKDQIDSRFGIGPRQQTCPLWFYLRKLQALKAVKIVWPAHWEEGNPLCDDLLEWIGTVDGVHCRFREPKHPTKSKNSSYYSFKFKSSGLSYEVALSLHESRIIWINGPFPAGTSDLNIFRKALREKIGKNKFLIADSGYKNEWDRISMANSKDSEEVAKFKSRARMRQEVINSRIKNFHCFDTRWRHTEGKFKVAFEAACVICQYQMDIGSPLYDV